jgi:Zn-dependent membrane protease YugP
MFIWLLILVPLAFGLYAQRMVSRTFRRYAAMPDRSGLTGAEVARLLLDAHGLRRLRIEAAPGVLSDHYDPGAGTLRLSAPVAHERSVAAIGIAAHEVAHAYQDAEGSRAYRARKRVGEPLARIAPVGAPLLFGGLLFGSLPLILLASVYMAGLVLFSIITLPVELQASRRAVSLLQQTGIARADELHEIREVLRAAACTYAAGIAQQLGIFLAVLLTAAALAGVRIPA